MYQFHGWISVEETYENRDIENEKIYELVEEIKNHITNLKWTDFDGIIDIRPFNGTFFLWVAGNPNHKPCDEYGPIELFKYVGQTAQGSYGILYVLDDEDLKDNNDDYFKVFVLTRGVVKEYRDHFLSPVMPTIFTFPMD